MKYIEIFLLIIIFSLTLGLEGYSIFYMKGVKKIEKQLHIQIPGNFQKLLKFEIILTTITLFVVLFFIMAAQVMANK